MPALCATNTLLKAVDNNIDCWQDNGTFSTRFNFTLADCRDKFKKNTCESLTTTPSCDVPFKIPISEKTPYLDLMFLFNDARNSYPNPTYGWKQTQFDPDWFIKIEILKCDCCLIDDPDLIYDAMAVFNKNWVGRYNNIDYQAIRLDILTIFNNLNVGGEDQEIIFKITTYDGRTTFVGPFVKEDCNQTTYFKSLATGFDCMGRRIVADWEPGMYIGNYFQFLPQVEFYAVNFTEEYSHEKQKNLSNTLNVTITEGIRVQSYKPIKPFYVEEISTVLGQDKVYIDYEDNCEVFFSGSLSKSNEESDYFMLDFTISKIACRKSSSCSSIPNIRCF